MIKLQNRHTLTIFEEHDPTFTNHRGETLYTPDPAATEQLPPLYVENPDIRIFKNEAESKEAGQALRPSQV